MLTDYRLLSESIRGFLTEIGLFSEKMQKCFDQRGGLK